MVLSYQQRSKKLRTAAETIGNGSALHVRVFISSPGDVGDERNPRLLKDELPYDPFLRGKMTLDPVSWDDPAAPVTMVATLMPQEAVNRFGCRPSECDIVIVVLWSRLGTHLKIDGTPYLSGTEYEYEEVVNAEHPPEILGRCCVRSDPRLERRVKLPSRSAHYPLRLL